MKPICDTRAQVRRETLDALPATLTVRDALRDAMAEELRCLLEACVVGAHRLRFREQQRSCEACERG